MSISSFASIQQTGEPLQQGDHLFCVEHARRDETLARNDRSEGGIGLDERFDLGRFVRFAALNARCAFAVGVAAMWRRTVVVH